MTTELAWAAGFFEGEGCIYVPPVEQGRGLRLSVAQSSDDDQPPPTLLRFAAVAGCGKVSKLGPNALSKKQRWMWRVQRRAQAQDVLDRLRPFLTLESETLAGRRRDPGSTVPR